MSHFPNHGRRGLTFTPPEGNGSRGVEDVMFIGYAGCEIGNHIVMFRLITLKALQVVVLFSVALSRDTSGH